jgi:two-component sensor histidine kinase
MVQTATLPLMLKQLRLSSIARHWQALLGKAERNGWDSAQYLSALCEQVSMAIRIDPLADNEIDPPAGADNRQFASFSFSR